MHIITRKRHIRSVNMFLQKYNLWTENDGFLWIMSLWGISAPADLIHVGGQEIHFSFVDGFPRGAGNRNIKSVKIRQSLACFSTVP